MKKISLLVLLSTLCVLFSSCSILLSSLTQKSDVEKLGDWYFEYEGIPDYYCLYFSFKDKNDEYVISDTEVDVRIVDDNNNELFNRTISVSRGDFVYKKSIFSEKEKTLAEVRINSSDMKKGTSSSGVVYFTVHKKNTFSFKEQYIRVYSCLPVN